MSRAEGVPRVRATSAGATRLTRESTVTAALAVADRVGVRSLTMRAVAEELGVAVMGLYRHIDGKDELLDAIADRALAEVEPPPAGVPWDDALRAFFSSFRATMVRHPSLGQVLADRPVSGPQSLDLTDDAFSVLLAAGFDPEGAVNAFTALLTYAIGSALHAVARLDGEAPSLAERSRLAGLQRARADNRPSLATVAPHLVIRGTHEQFTSGLHHLLAGLRADLDAAGRSRRSV